MTIENCINEENTLRFKSFSREDALNLGMLIYQRAKELNVNVSIRVTVNELVVFQFMLPKTTVNNEKWMQRKHNMVMARGVSTLRAKLERERDNRTTESYCLSPFEYSTFGGGFPINLIDSDLIGSVCVSGLTGEEDHELVVWAITEYLKK